jgi:galactokinase
MRSFAEVFGASPDALGDAPGRVNLLGEHTDYSEGLVLPASIAQRTRVGVRRTGKSFCSVYSANLDRGAQFTLDSVPSEPFARYLYGSLRALVNSGVDVPNLEVHVVSEIPLGAGLSSSAALEVATLRALRNLLSLDLDDIRIAQLAHHAETRYAGVQCGILDQMACSLLDGDEMLFLDTRSLSRRMLALPADSQILVIDSGIARTLGATRYNERRAECEEAARRLEVPTLRDVTDVQVVDALPDPLRRRARHVVTENARARRAAEDLDAKTFGALMFESHASLRDDYEVSIDALDELVGLLRTDDRVYGAKLTGAGFGGACVVLCRSGAARRVAERALAQYHASGHAGRMLVPDPFLHG